jgi:hypothetical protein
MDEQLMRDCLRMYRERENYYRTEWRKRSAYGLDVVEFLTAANAYENAAMMLEYALQGNAEVLRQYDYFGEDN